MSDEELGMDTFVERQSKRKWVTFTDANCLGQRLEIESQPIAVQPAIASRATCYYRTVDRKSVVKFAWHFNKRVSDAEHLRVAMRSKGHDSLHRDKSPRLKSFEQQTKTIGEFL